jgi:peptide deformylase
MVLDIITYPNEILTTPTKLLTYRDILGSDIQTLIEDMIDTCLDSDGSGLAANQVGRDVALCVIRHNGSDFTTLINPVIMDKKNKMHCKSEGCLSLPERFFNVKRHKKLTVSYLDGKGKAQVYTTKSKRAAQAISHEIDHLNGKTLIEKGKEVQ